MITIIEHRVNYSETDQMGLVYHARYVVWLDMARTEFLREAGMSYKDVEARGLQLSVTDLEIRYGQPARYDDIVRVRCWVAELRSRAVTFGYAVENAATNAHLARATTRLVSLNRARQVVRLPSDIAGLLGAGTPAVA